MPLFLSFPSLEVVQHMLFSLFSPARDASAFCSDGLGFRNCIRICICNWNFDKCLSLMPKLLWLRFERASMNGEYLSSPKVMKKNIAFCIDTLLYAVSATARPTQYCPLGPAHHCTCHHRRPLYFTRTLERLTLTCSYVDCGTRTNSNHILLRCILILHMTLSVPGMKSKT